MQLLAVPLILGPNQMTGITNVDFSDGRLLVVKR